MKCGLWLCSQYGLGDSLPDRFDDLVEQVRLADQAGFDPSWTGQHYLMPTYQQLQPFPLLGRLAAEAGSSPGASQKATLHAIQSLGERVLPALRDTDPTVSDGVSAAAWPAGKSRGVGAAGSDHRAGRSS